jgi:hypothetical protein
MNQLQGQIGKAASSAGTTTADAVYGPAIKAQTAVVKTLTTSQNNLKKSMDKLATAMEKAIEKAFKKKANGGIVGGAASGGLRGGLTWVGEEGPELVRLPASSTVYPAGQSRQIAAGAWASMLNEPRRQGPARQTVPAGVAAAGDGQPMVIHLSIAGRDFGELWVDAGRKQVRARGSIEATLQPPRGR